MMQIHDVVLAYIHALTLINNNFDIILQHSSMYKQLISQLLAV
jgi:hypothetical protein